MLVGVSLEPISPTSFFLEFYSFIKKLLPPVDSATADYIIVFSLQMLCFPKAHSYLLTLLKVDGEFSSVLAPQPNASFNSMISCCFLTIYFV